MVSLSTGLWIGCLLGLIVDPYGFCCCSHGYDFPTKRMLSDTAKGTVPKPMQELIDTRRLLLIVSLARSTISSSFNIVDDSKSLPGGTLLWLIRLLARATRP